MRHQMFPPNHSDNSFEWFRNQNQMIDEKFNYPEFNQFQDDNIRYYGNTIQPYSQNSMQNTELPTAQTTPQVQQTSQMIEPSPFGGPTIQQGNYGQTSPGQFMPQYNTGQYSSMPLNHGYQQSSGYYGLIQHQNPYMPIHQNQFGNQMNYLMQPQNGQMMQQGPFASPAMFAPSTPYPTQPKNSNQQNNGQSFQFSSILNQFKNSSGSYDVPKMMNTAGQMMNTMNQVGGLFKQIGFLFK
ncbi:YppG family protein [Gottfriedia luciferensis]|uniref:YppG family protein n=1 Tax=Gottfriedia luciferensis TaxID=178774 RepID=UPI001F305BBC|nr:YppG family protein [Gottfriedia luciferensis]